MGAGFLIVLLGLWGALIPFVGPYFNYGFGPNAAWHFTTNRLWLDILPGAVAVVGGLGLIAASRRTSGVTGGWLALVAGVWFIVGPAVSMFWGHAGAGAIQSGIGTPIGGHDRTAIELIGFFYGLGAVITMFAAFAVGRFASRPALAAGEDVAARRSEPLNEPQLAREPVIRRHRRGSTVEDAGRTEEPAEREPVRRA
jgi:hypothetical protein